MTEGPTDAELWQGLRNSNRDSLEKLYKRHFPLLLRYGNKICYSPDLAKDCLQDLFFQLWVKREKLQEVKSVRYYLMKWLKRDLVRHITRKKTGQQHVHLDGDDSEVVIQADAEDFFETSEHNSLKADLLRQVLAQLSNKEREVIYLRFFMQLPYDEISLIMNVGYQVVMNYMHRAMKTLRENELLRKLAGIFLLITGFFGIFLGW